MTTFGAIGFPEYSSMDPSLRQDDDIPRARRCLITGNETGFSK